MWRAVVFVLVSTSISRSLRSSVPIVPFVGGVFVITPDPDPDPDPAPAPGPDLDTGGSSIGTPPKDVVNDVPINERSVLMATVFRRWGTSGE